MAIYINYVGILTVNAKSTQKVSGVRRSALGYLGAPWGCPLAVGVSDLIFTRSPISRLPAGFIGRSSLVGSKDSRSSYRSPPTDRQRGMSFSRGVKLQELTISTLNQSCNTLSHKYFITITNCISEWLIQYLKAKEAERRRRKRSWMQSTTGMSGSSEPKPKSRCHSTHIRCPG